MFLTRFLLIALLTLPAAAAEQIDISLFFDLGM